MVPSSASQMLHHPPARAGATPGLQLCAGEPGELGKLEGCNNTHIGGTLSPSWGGGCGPSSPTASGGVAHTGLLLGTTEPSKAGVNPAPGTKTAVSVTTQVTDLPLSAWRGQILLWSPVCWLCYAGISLWPQMASNW